MYRVIGKLVLMSVTRIMAVIQSARRRSGKSAELVMMQSDGDAVACGPVSVIVLHCPLRLKRYKTRG